MLTNTRVMYAHARAMYIRVQCIPGPGLESSTLDLPSRTAKTRKSKPYTYLSMHYALHHWLKKEYMTAEENIQKQL